MFSYETENIIRKIQATVSAADGHVNLRTILSAPIHDAIKIYFRATITDTEERPRRFHTDKTADTDKIASDIDLLLPTRYVFNKDTFISLLTDAVHFQFNYLCRPRWTMKEFFFHNSSVKSLTEIKKRFTYFSAYEYYRKIFFGYVQKKGITQIDITTFDDITLKIDRLVLGEAVSDDFSILLQPLYDFVGYGRGENNPSLPGNALTLFFSDKGFQHICTYLESTLKEKQQDNLSLDELRMYLSEMPPASLDEKEIQKPEKEPIQTGTLDEAIAVKGPTEMTLSGEDISTDTPEESPAAPEHANPPTIEEPFEEEPVDVKSIDEAIEESEPSIIYESPDMDRSFTDDELFRPIRKDLVTTDETAEETTQIFAEDDSRSEQTNEESDIPTGDAASEDALPDKEISTDDTIHDDSSRFDKLDENLPDIFTKKEGQEPKQPTLHPLELLIEEDERKRFVRKLFNGDAAYFEVVVQTLNKINSWKEASLYLDEIFLVNGVDPYSTDSIHFTDKVYTRFSQKSML
jgi:hypothetical protein